MAKQVTFKSQGCNLKGILFLPKGFNEDKKYPTIVFSGPFNQVKEQMGSVYGPMCAKHGYLFLAFDHLGYGESEGEVRNNERGTWKMEGIRDAISYLRTQKFVDREHLYGLGACASGGYMAIVATTDKRLKAIATVCGMMDNQSGLQMGKDALLKQLKAANEARQREYETGVTEYIDAMGFETLDLSTLSKTSAQYEGYDYYMTKRAGTERYPTYSHRTVANLAEDQYLTSARVLAPYLYTPYLGVYGEKALQDTGPLTVQFFEACSEPKELFEVKGATHVSLYDKEEDCQQAADRICEFFAKY